jgi:hypothetical protein
LNLRTPKTLMLALAVSGTLAGCAQWNQWMAGAPMLMVGQRVTLTGDKEVPPVPSSGATANGVVMVAPDHSVSGAITTSGFAATAAHIHEAAPGVNGPVIVPMVKDGDNRFVFPPGSKLTDAQYDAYKAGNLYVNVHSAAHPGGELRAQIGG